MKTLVVILATLLTGCSVGVVSSTPRQITLVGDDTFYMDQLIKTAEAECKKYGRHALYAGRAGGGHSVFSCVD